MRAQKVLENIRFERGISKPQDIGVGKYREMQGLPEEVQKTILLLRDMGYWREHYDKGMHLRTEDQYGQDQFFWDYTKQEKQYYYQGGQMIWATLFWIDWKAPEQFYQKHENLESLMYETGGWPNFSGNVQVQKVDPNSEVAKYYGGPFTVEINMSAEEPYSSEPLIDLPDSYEKRGLKDSNEITSFISKKLKDGETYIKRFLNKKYKHLFQYESYGFERGSDPKESLRIGLKGRNIWNINKGPTVFASKWVDEQEKPDEKERIQKYIDGAAELLRVTPDKVRLAIEPFDDWDEEFEEWEDFLDSPKYFDKDRTYLGKEWDMIIDSDIDHEYLDSKIIDKMKVPGTQNELHLSNDGTVYVYNPDYNNPWAMLGTIY